MIESQNTFELDPLWTLRICSKHSTDRCDLFKSAQK